MNTSDEVRNLLGKMESKTQREKESEERERRARDEFPNRFLAVVDEVIFPCMEKAATELKQKGIKADVEITRHVVGGGEGWPCVTLRFASEKGKWLDGTIAVRMLRFTADTTNLQVSIAKRTSLNLERSAYGVDDGLIDYTSIRGTDLAAITQDSVTKEILSTIREGVSL